MIIAAFAGVGKSTFCEQNREKSIDFICMPYKYSNFEEVAEGLAEGESIKAHEGLDFVFGWQKDYFEAIKELEAQHPEKYIVIPTERQVLEMLYEEGIPYTLVYPHESLQEEYRSRYITRGDSETFVSIFADGWKGWMKSLKECPGENRIVLQAGEFFADVISGE